MRMHSLLLAGTLVAGSFIPTARAADEERENAARRAEALGQIATAAELTAFGRGELIETPQLKGIKNPDALVIAGGMLLRVHNLTEGKMGVLDAEVKDDKGAVIMEGPKPKSLADQAEDLFKEAEGIVLVNKGDQKALDALIAKAKADAVVKGAIGGPRSLSRSIPSGGTTHTFTIRFVPNSPATVIVNSSSKVQLDIYGEDGSHLHHGSPRTSHQFNWTTAPEKFNPKRPVDSTTRRITIKVFNGAGPTANYTLTTN